MTDSTVPTVAAREHAPVLAGALAPEDTNSGVDVAADVVRSAIESHLPEMLRQIEAAADILRQRTRRGDHEANRQLAETILGDARRLRAILADTSALREARSATSALRLAPVEVSDLMMDLLAEWQQSGAAYQFELALPGELPVATLDADRIRLALSSLLRAAVLVSAPRDTIRVSVRPHDDDIQVTVRTRRGRFPDGSLEALLQPFQHVALGSDELVTLGLELPLARTLVALHGGTLRAESAAPESGLSFSITMPRVPARVCQPSLPAEEPTPPTAPVSQRASAGHGASALIALRDARMARYLKANLEAAGHRCWVASDVDEAERRVDLEDPDIILLDTGLDEGSPAELLRRFRDLAGAAFVMLSRRYDPSECAHLLDLGASDYLVVPLSVDELLARLRVALRSRDQRARTVQTDGTFRSGGLIIDFDQRLVSVDGRPVSLSKTEYKLLRTLAEHAGMVLSHEMLLERVWGPGYGQEVEFAWVYVRRLRKKIEADPAQPRYIITVPGVGYKLANA